MDEKLKKYKDLLEELLATVEHAKAFDESASDIEIDDMIRELRQMIERLRRLKDNEQMIYEKVGEQPPVI